MTNDSNKDTEPRSEAEVVRGWWEQTITQPGPRAELRRAKSIDEVFFAPAFHDLRLRLAGTRWTNAERIALIAAVLARAKKHVTAERDGRRLGVACQMAQRRKGSEAARVSDLRFRRLLKTHDQERLFGLMPRIVALLDGTVDVEDLAKRLYWWNQRSRREWALEYYEHAPRTQTSD